MARLQQTAFGDSTRPDLMVGQFDYAALYGNGRYRATGSQISKFKGHFLINVLHGAPYEAESMRALDMELYDANAGDAPGHIQERKNAGHNDALLYGSRSVIAGCLAYLITTPQWLLPWELWVAWPYRFTTPPSRLVVATELQRWTKIPVDARRIRSCQWGWGTQWDTNVWYGDRTFTIPKTQPEGMF